MCSKKNRRVMSITDDKILSARDEKMVSHGGWKLNELIYW